MGGGREAEEEGDLPLRVAGEIIPRQRKLPDQHDGEGPARLSPLAPEIGKREDVSWLLAGKYQAATFFGRPGMGKEGKQITVKTNYFPLTALPEADVHHYELPFDSQTFQVRGNSHAGLAALVVAVVLPEDGGAAAANPKRAPREFRVRMRLVNSINMAEVAEYLRGRAKLTNNVLTGIMAVDVVLRDQPADRFVSVGRSFYSPEERAALGGGAEVWGGVFMSARPAPGRMLLNVDVSATAFVKAGPVIDFAAELLGARGAGELRRGLPEGKPRQLERALKSVKFFVSHRGERRPRYTAARLTRTPADKEVFADKDGNSISVAQYFQQHWGVRLEPCIATVKGLMFPLEVCHILPGQRFKGKLNETQTSSMIKFTCQPPDRRANKIMNNLGMLNPNQNAFGIQVRQELMQVSARVLPTPTVCYKADARDPTWRPRDGVWNLVGKKVARGTELHSWSVVSFCDDRS
ncbi:MAG: PAZ domain-containing protein, partial [Olpidium bornovanus]